MPETPQLRRDLGLWGAAAIVVGTVIGSGIFIVPAAMVQKVGDVQTVFLVWIAAGLLTLAGALTYAELAAMLPEAGGEYVYLREAYGPFFGFLYGWTQTWVAKSGSIATLATGFYLYLANFFPALETVLWGAGEGTWRVELRTGQLLAMGVILGLGILNYFGVRVGGNVQILVTLIKVACILAIIGIGLWAPMGTSSNMSTSVPSAAGFVGFFAAMVSALWAYDGWNNVTMVASEIKNPQRNLPLALTAGTLAVVVLYLLTNVAYFYVLPASAVASSDRVAATMMRQVLGEGGAAAVSVAAMISIFAAINGSILSGSRVPYAMAVDRLFPRQIAEVHPGYHTPAKAILLLSGWSCVLLLSGKYNELADMVIFASWILYALAAASVIVLRRKRPELARPYRTVGYPVVPVLFVLVACCLLGNTFIASPRQSLQGLVLISLGLPFYFHWKRSRVN